MRIASLTLHGAQGSPQLELNPITPALHCYFAPAGSGKTTAADFLAHVLYGKLPVHRPSIADHTPLLEGEAIVEASAGQFRLRRYQDGTPTGRLTIAARDQSPVDPQTVRKMLGGLSPAVMSRLFAINFDEPPQVGALLAEDFAHEFRVLDGAPPNDRRLAELTARRDALAQELEARIAAERRASHDLDQQSRALDRAVRSAQQETADLEQRLRTVETALAETDARLRYRRLELNIELRRNSVEADDWEPLAAELDEQIARWRATLGDLANREASVRARLAQVRPGDGAGRSTVTDERAWLAVARQLAMDLEGEVARLARASASQQCVCGDSHPRMRPIVETLQRQLGVLESLVDQQQRSLRASELAEEAQHLARSQAELRQQLEHLLDRRHALSRAATPSKRPSGVAPSAQEAGDSASWFSAADAEQLERRRLELENERFGLAEQLRSHTHRLRELRARRAERDRQRAALLSVRSIEHVQRELADVQQKLEAIAAGSRHHASDYVASDSPQRASDYLAQLTDGRLIRIQLVDQGRALWVVNRAGDTLRVESLSAGERDQMYLSLSLALAGAAARHGVNLPLLLDDPFVRLDAHAAAALAAVLDHFSRQGHQVLVFTSRRHAADRFSALGCRVEELNALRRHEPIPSPTDPPTLHVRTVETAAQPQPTAQPITIAHSSPASGPAATARAPRPRRFYLELASQVGDAPSIGPKTAQRLANAGIGTVADLLAVDPVEGARRTGSRQIKADTIRTWQRQARLVCQIPQLRSYDAQLLVACGLTSADQIAHLRPEEVLERVTAFCDSKEGEKIVRGENRPDLAHVTQWISRAAQRRNLHAA